MRMLLRSLALLVLVSVARGQPQPAAQPQFEAASIRPNAGLDRRVSINAPSPGAFRAENVWLRFLIQIAWNVKDFQVSGGPGWAGSDRFDISAKAAGGATFDQMRPMLRSLLEDRFGLVLRSESRVMPVFALVAAKGGVRLKAADEGGCVTPTPGTPQPAAAPGQKPLSFCGSMATSPRSLTGTAISMEQFTAALSNIMQRTVIDQTGYTRSFDVHLEWTADQSTPGLWAPGLAPSQPSANVDSLGSTTISGPTIFTVLQEQLGLRLESTRGPVTVWVIDRAEKPSSN